MWSKRILGMSKSFGVMTLLGVTVISPDLSAQEENIAEQTDGVAGEILAPLTVTGDWLGDADEEIVRRHPGARNAIREQEIEESGATSIREIMRRMPGVIVPENNGTGSGDFALNIGVRGLGSRLTPRTTVLLDGVPLANAPYGQPQLSLAPTALGNLKAIDLVRGGGSVRFGPQNVGGVLNFVTKDIPDDFGGEITTRGELWDGAGGTGQGQADFLVGGSTDNGSGLAFLGSANHGSGFRENDQKDIDDAMVKYRLALTDNQRLEGRVHAYRADADLPGPLSQAAFSEDPFQSTHSYEKFDGSREEVVLGYVNEISDDQELEVKGYYTHSTREFQLSALGDDTTMTRLERLPRRYDVYGFEPRYSAWAETGVLDHEWTVGYRFIHESAREKRYRRNFAAGTNPFAAAESLNRDTAGRTNAHAFYVDDRIEYGNWSFTPGIRFEMVDIERYNYLNGFKDKEDYREPLPSLQIAYQATPDWMMFGNYGRSFASVEHLSLGTSADNPLEPEKADTYEVGTRFQTGGFSTEGTLFLIDFQNQIEFDSTVGMNVNKGESLHRGFEGGIAYDFANWNGAISGLSVYANYTYTKATRESGENTGNDLGLYSAHVGSVGARYALEEWVFNLDGYAQSEQYSDDSNIREASADGKTGMIPGFAYWNVRVERDFSDEDLNLRLAGGIKNLFDRRYYTRASVENNGGIYVGAPRTFFVEARMAF